jgi:hypothetical protein
LGSILTASPPAEKTTARQDQAGKSRTDDGAGNMMADGAKIPYGDFINRAAANINNSRI